MGATYTRQSTYTDGDTITADHTNDEFDQLLAAFAASTGHTHDGTAGEGGPISALVGHTLTFGAGTSGTDITITFDGESNDGVLKWMEDEDYFEFSDDILIATTEKLQFRDTAIYINSSADGQLDIVADTEIQIAATTIDINGLVDISGNLSVGGNLDVTGTFDLSDANFTNAGSISLDSISGDADANTSITFSGSDVITIATGGSTAATFNASQALTLSGILDVTDATDASDATGDTGALRTEGGASIAKKLYVGTDLAVSGATTLAATSFGDANITNVGSIALDTIINDGTDITIDSSGDIVLDAGGANVTFKDDGTSILDISNVSSDAVLTVSTADKNFTIKGTDGASAITALDIDMALAGKATFSGDVVVTGDLTITGDDLTMATNTAGALLIADGTNFNPTVVGDLTEISTAANDDVFLAIDTSGGGLKRITRSTILAGSGSSSDIANVVEDTSPQLGGNLDMNGADIVTTSNATLDLAPNGTGTVVVRGNTNSAAIVFNCESNSHGQKVFGQPHSASVTNALMLPAGASSTLVSLVSTDTLTNKTLTAAKIVDGGFLADANGNELIVFQTTGSAVNQLEITNNASGSDPILAATGGDTNIGITLTPKGTGVITIAAGNLDYGGTAVTSTGAELNILDGVNTTAAELNIMDGGTSATSTTVVDADRVVLNDNGTMVQVAVTDLAAYFDDEITAMPNLITTAATTVGALNSGSITSGFGTIDTGASAITTTGLISGGSLDIDNVLINGTTIGHTDDTDLITLADGLVTVAGEVSLTTLDIGGTNIATTAAEINLIDGGTARGTTALADGDGILINDAGTMRMTSVETVKTYMAGSAATKGFAIAMAIVFG